MSRARPGPHCRRASRFPDERLNVQQIFRVMRFEQLPERIREGYRSIVCPPVWAGVIRQIEKKSLRRDFSHGRLEEDKLVWISEEWKQGHDRPRQYPRSARPRGQAFDSV